MAGLINNVIIGIYYKMSYSLVMILELNSVSEVQYKEIGDK